MDFSHISTTLPWYRQLLARMGVLMPVKALGTMAFMVLFFWAYFAILRQPAAGEAWVMPLMPVDDWVPFTPLAYPFYVSLWVYVSLPPAFLGNFRMLALFGFWVSALCLFCLGMFWLFPTAVPAAGIDWSLYPELDRIKGLDAAGNACPSLHVGSAVFAAFWLEWILRRVGAPSWIRWGNGFHCLLIAWSTLATRQHVALDVLAGALVGGLFAGAALIHARKLAAVRGF